jgi:hypothetical protein
MGRCTTMIRRRRERRLFEGSKTSYCWLGRGTRFILKPLVEAQATFVAVTLRQMILAFPLKAARKMVGLPDDKAAKRILDKVAHDLCEELASFPAKITDPDWLEKTSREKS